jgi:CheY-like chemotaxis protein
VSIRATAAGPQAREVAVSVSDTGIGIAPEVLPHVFELFVQGARPSGVRAGLGLGLSIVQSLVELHSGRVESRSEGPGRGSEFVVHLPLHESTPSEAEAKHVEDGSTGREPSFRILVVDDNLDAAEMLVEWLQTLGHLVRLATDGPTALEVAREFGPDVALLDIGLPLMDGYEVGRRLRQGPGGAHVRLIALTGYGQESDYERSHRAGFAEHLVKPIDLDAVARSVARVRAA